MTVKTNSLTFNFFLLYAQKTRQQHITVKRSSYSHGLPFIMPGLLRLAQ